MNEATWVAISALVGAVAAIATASMAWLTRGLAEKTAIVAAETKDLATETRALALASAAQIDQAERHHLDSLVPIVTLRVSSTKLGGVPPPNVMIEYGGTIYNAGPGPATNVSAIIQPGTFVARRYQHGNIAASTSDEFERTERYENVMETSLVSFPYKAAVLFSDIFGRRGAIFLSSHSGSSADCVIDQLIRPGVESEAGLRAIYQGRLFPAELF